jgi:hypothetical protein
MFGCYRVKITYDMHSCLYKNLFHRFLMEHSRAIIGDQSFQSTNMLFPSVLGCRGYPLCLMFVSNCQKTTAVRCKEKISVECSWRSIPHIESCS